MQTVETPTVLLDVREKHEYAHCRIEGSVNMPMNSVPGRLAELDRDTEIVTICHHGMRSGAAADYLLGRGYTRITNLQGRHRRLGRAGGPRDGAVLIVGVSGY